MLAQEPSSRRGRADRGCCAEESSVGIDAADNDRIGRNERAEVSSRVSHVDLGDPRARRPEDVLRGAAEAP